MTMMMMMMKMMMMKIHKWILTPPPPKTDMCLYLKKLFEFKFSSLWSISTLQCFHMQYGWHMTDAFKWIPFAAKSQSVWTQFFLE